MKKRYYRIFFPVSLILIFLFLNPVLKSFLSLSDETHSLIGEFANVLIIAMVAWGAIELVRILKFMLLRQYDIEEEDNLKSRKVHTQINILENVVIFLILLLAIGGILLSFESVRKIGISLFASAGLAGVILGFAAQKVLGTLFAGIQIAITQPLRLGDAVLVENEWGWIEEITLSYVVIRIWDKRRLVLPSTYFIEKPFQNWTRNSSDIIGTIFLYTDYSISFEALRQELTRLLRQTDLWDQQVNVLQVTEAKPTNVEIRILVSAKNSPTAWDLRVYIREKMIEFIQKNYPESLPRTRIMMVEETDAAQ